MRRLLLLTALLSIAFVSIARPACFSYVYSRGGNNYTTLSHGSLEDVLRLQKRFSGTYLWAEVDGKQYLIRDAGILAEVAIAARPTEALGPDQRALHDRMRPLERQQDRLERELDALTDRDEDDDDLSAAERARMRRLESELRDIERELRHYEIEERELDRKEDAAEKIFDAKVKELIERAIERGLAERL